MTTIVLASQSTSRRRLLESAGLFPTIIVSHVDEETEFFNSLSPADMVIALAITKAHTVREQIDFPAIIIGCDSTFEFDGQSLGKPGTPEIATERAKRVRGNSGFIPSIEGDYTNVVGISMPFVRKAFANLGYTWPEAKRMR